MWLRVALMQATAIEKDLSETAFLAPNANGGFQRPLVLAGWSLSIRPRKVLVSLINTNLR